MTQPVIVDYDPRWPELFESLSASIWPTVENLAERIEHVGSTSVPGLAAKPIIDMDVVVASEADAAAAVAAIETLGYDNLGALGVDGRIAFADTSGKPKHHLYVVWHDNKPHRDHVDFRDYLREHPEECERYAALKREIQDVYLTDPEQYTFLKWDLITEILYKARPAGSYVPQIGDAVEYIGAADPDLMTYPGQPGRVIDDGLLPRELGVSLVAGLSYYLQPGEYRPIDEATYLARGKRMVLGLHPFMDKEVSLLGSGWPEGPDFAPL